MEFGDPRGLVTVTVVRRARELGYLVGSCSDRTVAEQRDLWSTAGLEADFTVPKQGLALLRERFAAATWLHLGDTEVDRRLAAAAGFDFLHSLTLAPDESWLLRHAGGAGAL
jgi:hypothetical protein